MQLVIYFVLNRALEDEPEKPGLGTTQTKFKAVLC